MKANYVVYSDGAESMAYLDQERGVGSVHLYLFQKIVSNFNLQSLKFSKLRSVSN